MLLLATRSTDKAREISQILHASTPIITLQDAGVEPDPREDAIEAFDTFRLNALAKAQYFHALTGLPTLADDSGICAHALDGRPGVRSRRFSGRSDLDGIELDRANNRALLDALADAPDPQRTVHYVCAAVSLRPDEPPICTIGTVRGLLLREPRGDRGFGYDPLFLIPEIERTFAEIDASLKHRFSHRGRAFRALANALRPASPHRPSGAPLDPLPQG